MARARYKHLKEEHKIVLKARKEQETKEKEAGKVILGLLKKNVVNKRDKQEKE